MYQIQRIFYEDNYRKTTRRQVACLEKEVQGAEDRSLMVNHTILQINGV